MQFPFPGNRVLFVSESGSPSSIYFNVQAYGCTKCWHIPFVAPVSGSMTRSKTKSSNYRMFNSLWPNNYPTGIAYHFIYVQEAEGLVKLQFAISFLSVKKKERFALAAMFNRGYYFHEIQVTSGCKINFSRSTFQKFNFFRDTKNAFDVDLPEFNKNETLTLPQPGKYYLRFSYDINTDIVVPRRFELFSSTFSPAEGDSCTNYCVNKSLATSLFPTVPNICSCDGYRIFDSTSESCIQCAQNSCVTIRYICGNGIIQQGEECDNQNQIGCTNCKVDYGYNCTGYICQTQCGDGIRAGTQACDNKNETGCTNCTVDYGYNCTGDYLNTSSCQTVCGDGIRAGTQACDNKNETGCTNCTIDYGYNCTGNYLNTSSCQTLCGDGIRAGIEECDNNNKTGCTNCTIDYGYNCTGDYLNTSSCQTSCGDGIRAGTQECDNKNQTGCGSCIVESGYICTENRFSLSTCSAIPKEDEVVEACTGSECDGSYKIIIGVCVGVGLAIILGFGIYCKVVSLKKQAYLDKSSKPNIETDERIGSKENIQSSQIIV